MNTKNDSKALEALRESEEKYRFLFDAAPVGIGISDLEGNVLDANLSMQEMMGYTLEEFRKVYVQATYADPDERELLIRTLKETGRIRDREIRLKRKDGTIYHALLNADLVELSGQRVLLTTARDITERKLAEEEIRRYAHELEESKRLKELFIDIMHHDLLNPLTAACGFVELLEEEETEPHKKAYLETIERNLTRALDLIESATRYSRVESMESIDLKDIDLKIVIEEVIKNLSPLASHVGMNIQNRITQSMPFCGNKIIEGVFDNLITNALKYATGGKKIQIGGEDGGDSWKIRVIDFGDGINDNDKTSIFERFHMAEKKGIRGSGLGLAISRKIVELHRGRIWVEDNPDGGAVFIVELPKSLNYQYL